MTGKQTMFFTTTQDIQSIIINFESKYDLMYYKAGMSDNKVVTAFDSILDVPNLGFTSEGDWNRIDRYMIMRRSTDFNIREVPQKKGGVKFVVDSTYNPKSIELRIGGIYTEKENVIVAGRVATISDDSDTLELYSYLSKKIKKEFKRFGMFYVGKSAEQKMKEGWRLVQDERRSKGYDLTLLG